MTSETSPSLLPYRRGWSSEAAPHRHPSAVPTSEGAPHRPRRVGRPDPLHQEREAAMTPGENMQIRTLGKTGLQVTELCVGTSAIGSMPKTYGYEVAEDRAPETLRRVFHGPITFIDTSNEYGQDGSSERLIGTVLLELGGVPEGFLVATKVDPDSTGDFSGRRVHASVRESRERLGLDHLLLNDMQATE